MRKYVESPYVSGPNWLNDMYRVVHFETSEQRANLAQYHNKSVEEIRVIAAMLAERLRLTPEYPLEKVQINSSQIEVHWIGWGDETAKNTSMWSDEFIRINLRCWQKRTYRTDISFGVALDGRPVYETRSNSELRGTIGFLSLAAVSPDEFSTANDRYSHPHATMDYLRFCIPLMSNVKVMEYYGIKITHHRRKGTRVVLYSRYHRRKALSPDAYRMQYGR
jgi:hypothetical protein